ncbi:hypothetical protein [Sphingomonas rubra]|uniref:Uncharacterized protein n=1 Tax=Sphingomonas rubra TaxID=634430 RepID=A0A1I5QYN4_9SPHN|nr:hypothetical protein [Sphingomonas rubra]SFP51197.1 hypothetical protein SAMN04488241_102376 [Sphingomonas rubra]
MASAPAPKPQQEVIPAKRAAGKLTPVERVIERSDIKIDVAACIRNTFYGVALVIFAVGFVMYPETLSLPNAAQTIARIFVR